MSQGACPGWPGPCLSFEVVITEAWLVCAAGGDLQALPWGPEGGPSAQVLTASQHRGSWHLQEDVIWGPLSPYLLSSSSNGAYVTSQRGQQSWKVLGRAAT